ncbi:MAG: polyprenyl synthetase family protein [Candidatus Omnitrophota bacterium]
MSYENFFRTEREKIEQALQDCLPPEATYPEVLHQAMRYAVLGEGKRFRPVLTLAACEALGGDTSEALWPAVSIELIHASSLVHDDLPSMDNDDLRRGKPSCHKKFGEAVALLAGDALIVQAFGLLTHASSPERTAAYLAEISTATGGYGMIGGQIADLVAGEGTPDLAALDYISIQKTGQLIKASAVCGAIAAGASRDDRSRIQKFGELLGLLFQAVDDFLDGDGYLKAMKAQELGAKIRDLTAAAKREIKPWGARGARLEALLDFMIGRISR